METVIQDELVKIMPQMYPGNFDRTLLDTCMKFERGDLQLAPFQRDFVWKKDKIISWIKTIEEQNAIGVILTYQIKGGTTTYLADGYQRVKATLRYIANPNEYGKKYSSEDAKRYADSFTLPVQHRIYSNQEEAHQAFLMLNNGTVLQSGEIFKGYLILTENGEYLYQYLPKTLMTYESPLRAKSGGGLGQADKCLRDSFNIYNQYINKIKERRFHPLKAKNISDKKVVEIVLQDYASKISFDQMSQDLKKFESFIASHFAHLSDCLQKSGLLGHGFSANFIRWTVHVHLWWQNNSYKIGDYNEFMMKLTKSLAKAIPEKRFSNSRFYYTDDGMLQDYTFRLESIEPLDGLGKHIGYDKGYQTKEIRNKNFNTAPGWDEHHPNPFSISGNGPTKPLPSITNRSIGNKTQTESE